MAIVPTEVRLDETTVELRVVPVKVPAAAVIVCEPALVKETDVPLSEILVFAREIVPFEPSDGVCETLIPVPAVRSDT